MTKTQEDYAREIVGHGCLCECIQVDWEEDAMRGESPHLPCDYCKAVLVIREIQGDVRKDIEEKLRAWRTQYDPGKESLDKYAQTVIDSAIKFVRGKDEFA